MRREDVTVDRGGVGAVAPLGGRQVELLLRCVRLAVVVCFLLFLPRLTEQFEAPKAAALRVLGLGGLGAALAAGSSLRRRRWRAIDAAVLGWLGVEIVSTALSDSPILSLLGEPAQREGLLTSFALAGIYLAARLGTRSAEDARGTLNVALAAGAASSLYALAQALGLDPLTWARTSAAAGVAVRPFGTFGHPNLLGVISSALLSAAVAMALLSSRRRVSYALAAVPLAVVTVLTLSRGAWLGAAAGLLAAFALAWWGAAASGLSRRGLLYGAAAVAIGALVIVAGPWGEPLRHRLADLLAAAAGMGSTRIEIWRSALAAWAERPWIGHGPDTFALVSPRFQTPTYWRYEWAGVPAHAHSIYLHTLATRGVLGVAARLAAVVAFGLALRSAWRAGGEARRLVPPLAAASCALAVCGAFGALGIGGALLLAVAAATTASLGGTGAPADPRRRAASGTLHRSRPLLAAVLLAAPALLWGVVELAASSADRRAQELVTKAGTLEAGSPSAALRGAADLYGRAEVLAPYDDGITRRRAYALLYLAEHDPDPLAVLALAEQRARRAIARVPLRSINHHCLGVVLAAAAKAGAHDRLAEAEAAYEKSLALAPYNGIAMVDLGRDEIDLKRPRQALDPLRRAAELYPEAAAPLYQLARAEISLGDRTTARATLERALAANWHGQEAERLGARRLLDALRADPTPRSHPVAP